MKKSFTLIDVLVSTSLILIIFLGVSAGFRLGIKVVAQSQDKITATAIANQEIEMARNLPYESVGTIGGILPFAEGSIERSKTVIRNNVAYAVDARVKYVVDEADGVAEPEDFCPNDYKRMEVKVSWAGQFGGEVILTSDISPINLIQECSQTGGILSVLVFDAYGIMIASPLIEIFNTDTGLKIDFATPSAGQHYFVLPANDYKVAVSKGTYSQSRTYGSDEITFPEKPHPIVIEGQLTEIGFSIDKLSDFSVSAFSLVGEEYVASPDVPFFIRGEKIIGLDEDEQPVYKYSETLVTDSNGQLNVTNLEWDSYWFSIDPSVGLDLVDTNPEPQPINLNPDTSLAVGLYVEADNSLLVTAKDEETLEPIFSAMVELHQLSLGYDKSQYTDENGRTYFIPLEQGIYNLDITAPGYNLYSDTIGIVGDSSVVILLERIE